MRSLFGRHLEYGPSDRLFFREGTIFVVWMWAVKDGVWIEFVRVRFFFFCCCNSGRTMTQLNRR